MSAKMNKTINSAMGVPKPNSTVVIDFTTSTIESGLIPGAGLFRLAATEDVIIEMNPVNDGELGLTNSMLLFSGVPEIMSSPLGDSLDMAVSDVHILASGESTAGKLFVTKMSTRGA